MRGKHANGNPEIVLNFITPHQKWGIHSTYSDNLLMLTLNRGGPVVWISETDAKQAGIARVLTLHSVYGGYLGVPIFWWPPRTSADRQR